MATPTNLPASFVSANVLTAAQMNDLRGAFRILQVVYGSTTTQVVNAGTTYVDVGASVTITPQSTTNKILLIANTAIYAASADANVYVQLLRASTSLATSISNDSSGANSHNTSSILYLDSPSTTSATTYKTQFKNNLASRTSYVSNAGTLCSIVALEVSA
jgi:hypothetical protein